MRIFGLVDPRAESRVRLSEAGRRSRTLFLDGVLERLFERLLRSLAYTRIWRTPQALRHRDRSEIYGGFRLYVLKR